MLMWRMQKWLLLEYESMTISSLGLSSCFRWSSTNLHQYHQENVRLELKFDHESTSIGWWGWYFQAAFVLSPPQQKVEIHLNASVDSKELSIDRKKLALTSWMIWLNDWFNFKISNYLIEAACELLLLLFFSRWLNGMAHWPQSHWQHMKHWNK